MVEIRPFMPSDFALLDLDAMQAAQMDQIANWRAEGHRITKNGPAWTAVGDGRVLGCAGVSLVWRGRGTAWCMLSRDIPKTAWISIHRAVLARLPQLHAAGFFRIEAETAFQWLPGERWLRMLGFEYEGLSRAFGPDGRDFTRWARIDG